MIFSLNILNHRQTTTHALNFAEATLQAQHQIALIFFHDSGVLCAQEAQQQWSALSTQHQIPLILCVSSAEKHAIDTQLLPSCFKLGSLIQLIEAEGESDKVIAFK